MRDLFRFTPMNSTWVSPPVVGLDIKLLLVMSITCKFVVTTVPTNVRSCLLRERITLSMNGLIAELPGLMAARG
jgi:hypothetical protein